MFDPIDPKFLPKLIDLMQRSPVPWQVTASHDRNGEYYAVQDRDGFLVFTAANIVREDSSILLSMLVSSVNMLAQTLGDITTITPNDIAAIVKKGDIIDGTPLLDISAGNAGMSMKDGIVTLRETNSMLPLLRIKGLDNKVIIDDSTE